MSTSDYTKISRVKKKIDHKLLKWVHHLQRLYSHVHASGRFILELTGKLLYIEFPLLICFLLLYKDVAVAVNRLNGN